MKFENPYLSCADKRLTTDVSKEDYYLIKSMRPGASTITGTLGTLWHKLCNELRKRNICDVSKIDEFEHFVANSELSLSGDVKPDTVSIDRGEYEQLRLDSEN